MEVVGPNTKWDQEEEQNWRRYQDRHNARFAKPLHQPTA